MWTTLNYRNFTYSKRRECCCPYYCRLIGNAGQHVRCKLRQTLDVALHSAVSVLEAEAQRKEMKLFMKAQRSAVLMTA